MRYSNTDIAELVRSDEVHRAVYTDPAIFELEIERIWGKTWIYVGHESQVKKPGDYYATEIGRQPVLLLRHKDGQVRVFYNRCAHKGAQLVGDMCGNARALRCAYHGWVYDTDGTVLTIPRMEGYAGTPMNKGEPRANLRPVARVASYRGFVFASLAPTGPDLASWLGGAAVSLDNLCDRSPEGEVEMGSGPLRYVHDSNWKMWVENLNDAMHPMVAHASSAGTARQVAKQLFEDNPAKTPFEVQMLGPFASDYQFFDDIGVVSCVNGHGYMGGKVSMESSYSVVGPYMEAMHKAYGPERTKDILSTIRHNTVIYPNLTVKCAIQQIRVVKPIAVDKFVVESWVFRLKGAPEEMYHRTVTYCNLINSSANLVGPDDYEAYHRMQRGLQSAGGNSDWVSMHRYLDREAPDETGDLRAIGTSDLSFRNQYQAWKSYLLQEAA